MVLKILKSKISDFYGIKIPDVFLNYESKKRIKNRMFWDWIRGECKKYGNFDIYKNHNFGVIM